ncbi:MAG: hypothetical protein UT09_C0009G0011 [Parcubacteria group bacterium GW2011_GWF2_38_8]|nr:MAG: hypothetical protein UT09_C0009G0011 [Parcubacteria group bacterium GW2011_GWF2_38_8]
MADEYSKFIIKDYKYWTVYIHQNQSYLGRCIVWCKRENALDLTEATPEEQKELFVVLNDLKNAVTKVFQPDWFNYSFLGNGMRHLHEHFIPRYAKPKEFMNITFEDKLWGHNYKTDYSFIISSDILNTIQVKIKEIITYL